MIGAVPARSGSDRAGPPHAFARRRRVARPTGRRPRCRTHATVRTRLRLSARRARGETGDELLRPADLPGPTTGRPAARAGNRRHLAGHLTCPPVLGVDHHSPPPRAIRGPMPELPKIVQWCGSHFLDFDAAAHQDQKCVARRHVRVVRVAPLPADLHRWRGLRLAAPQHLSHSHPCPRLFAPPPPSPFPAPHRTSPSPRRGSAHIVCHALPCATRRHSGTSAHDPGRTPAFVRKPSSFSGRAARWSAPGSQAARRFPP